MAFKVLFQALAYSPILPSDWSLHLSCTISTWGEHPLYSKLRVALLSCNCYCWANPLLHYRRKKVNNHVTILIHMPGTHFTTGWMDGPYLLVPIAELESATLRLLVSCSVNWTIQMFVLLEEQHKQYLACNVLSVKSQSKHYGLIGSTLPTLSAWLIREALHR